MTLHFSTRAQVPTTRIDQVKRERATTTTTTILPFPRTGLVHHLRSITFLIPSLDSRHDVMLVNYVKCSRGVPVRRLCFFFHRIEGEWRWRPSSFHRLRKKNPTATPAPFAAGRRRRGPYIQSLNGVRWRLFISVMRFDREWCNA